MVVRLLDGSRHLYSSLNAEIFTLYGFLSMSLSSW
jgi:hypothetical protein